MKIKIKLFAITVIILAAISCQKNEIEGNAVLEESINPNDPIVKLIIEDGWELSDITLSKDGSMYLVQSDIAYSTALEDYVFTKQSRTSIIVSQSRIKNIKYYVNPNLIWTSAPEDNWLSAIQSAVSAYNGLSNTKLNIGSRVYSPNQADLIFEADNNSLHNITIAVGYSPSSSGRVCKKIKINLDYKNNKQVSQSSKIHNMVHEIGHTIGLGHTNWRTLPNEPSRIHINGTSYWDFNSVMNGRTADYSWRGFTFNDKKAVQILYPR